MELKTKKKRLIIIFLLSLGIWIPVTIVVDKVWYPIVLNREDAFSAHQWLAYLNLSKCIERTGKIAPKLEDVEGLSKNLAYMDYYPAAWNNAGQVLFKHESGNLHFVTFGDGRLATLTYLSEGKADRSVTHIAPSGFPHTSRVVLHGITAISITLFLSYRKFNKV